MTGELQETAPCAAITEKRPNRLSGCVGVFFQLFDWNRRFAKKKLFSRKSLLPGKQVSKRFAGNDKMLRSNLNLIDDENRGSFPNRGEVMELKKHEMRSPSLVARLMGLESMPSSHRDKGKNKKKPSKNQDDDQYDVFDEEEEEEYNGLGKLRPQKMQRTIGASDRRVAVKKFGSDALQIKNVLPRVRKHHQYNSNRQHQKLASPVRSPRLNRRSSRLIDAATRILEPGKRNTKFAIAYPGSTGVRRCDNAAKEPVEVVVLPEFQCGYNNSVASCKTCGSLVDVNGSNPVAEETVKNMLCVPETSPFQRSKRNVFWRNEGSSVSVKDSTDHMVRKGLHCARYDLNWKHGKDEISLPGVRNRFDFNNQVLQKERFAPEARSFTLQSKRDSSLPANAINRKEKDFIAMPSRNHPSKTIAKFENSDLMVQRKSAEESYSRSRLSSPARKRRLACDSVHRGGSSSMSPLPRRFDGECSCACSDVPSSSNETKLSPLRPGCALHTSVAVARRSDGECSCVCCNVPSSNNETKLSQLKPGCAPHTNYYQGCKETKEMKGGQRVPRRTGERNPRTLFARPQLDVGTLGLIQQKLRELASIEEDDDAVGGSALPNNKSASLILHELLSSLALEQRFIRDTDMSYADTTYRRKGKTELWSPIGNANSEYTSPGSVLDASFSNESCFSNSFDNISVPGQIKLPLEPIEPDWDILEDSAKRSSNYQVIASLVSHISNVLCCLSNMGLILTQQRFKTAREVIIHTELLIGNTTAQETYLITTDLFDELMIYAARSDNLVNHPGLTGGFLVDAMIEHLEERNISCGGLKPSNAKAHELIRGVLEDVPKWARLARISMDEVISMEMEKWLDLETHLFGVESEIAYEILWCLVGELTTDLRTSLPVKTTVI